MTDPQHGITPLENRHAVTHPALCEAMGRKYQLGNLKRIEPTKDPILKWDCVFEGPQTSFEDDRNG